MGGSWLKGIDLWAIQVLRNAVGGVSFPRNKKHYEGVQFNVI